jgi:hypothetical protein
MIKVCLGLSSFGPPMWAIIDDVLDWWHHVALAHPRKAMCCLLMLVSWRFWTERNTSVFNNKQTLPIVVFEHIKLEAAK